MRIRQSLIVLIAAAALGCASGPAPETSAVPAPAPEPAPVAAPEVPIQGTPDTEIGLAIGAITEILVPPSFNHPVIEPGDTGMRGSRLSELAAPVVPHLVEDYLPITRDENLCAECHDMGPGQEIEEGDAIPLPDSHFTDLRNAPTEITDLIAGARYNCVSCHVALTDAEPLVANPVAG